MHKDGIEETSKATQMRVEFQVSADVHKAAIAMVGGVLTALIDLAAEAIKGEYAERAKRHSS